MFRYFVTLKKMSFNKSIVLLLSQTFLNGCKPGNSEKCEDKLQTGTQSSISGNFSISGAYAFYPLANQLILLLWSLLNMFSRCDKMISGKPDSVNLIMYIQRTLWKN
jgi:hypothetical protein